MHTVRRPRIGRHRIAAGCGAGRHCCCKGGFSCLRERRQRCRRLLRGGRAPITPSLTAAVTAAKLRRRRRRLAGHGIRAVNGIRCEHGIRAPRALASSTRCPSARGADHLSRHATEVARALFARRRRHVESGIKRGVVLGVVSRPAEHIGVVTGVGSVVMGVVRALCGRRRARRRRRIAGNPGGRGGGGGGAERCSGRTGRDQAERCSGRDQAPAAGARSHHGGRG